MHNVADGNTVRTEQAAPGASQKYRYYLYEILITIIRDLAHCESQDELLSSLFDALVSHSPFPIFFIAKNTGGQPPLEIVNTHGIEAELLPALARQLASPDFNLGQAGVDFTRDGAVTWSLPAAIDASDIWLRYLQQQEIRESALVPILHDGLLIGLISLYAQGSATFDAEHMRLLNEMVAAVAFTFRTLSEEELRCAAEQKASQLDSRFQRVFDASPSPMLVYSLSSMRLRAINRAHRRMLGYASEDIATTEQWFEQVYPDPAERAKLYGDWLNAIPAAKAGEVIRSPEMTLHCKDGSKRIVTGTMTIVGDDMIVAWTDLTEIRRNEESLRESERRFRNMIEQTISGIYVRRHGKFIYVNPRCCEIIGWPADELLGRNVVDFAVQDPEVLERIQDSWKLLHAGATHVAYSVAVIRKDGRVVELGVNSKIITWDDGLPATIVMAQDITERKHAEDQIAGYVQQLKRSLRGTLQAVSHMVELRDPYTAGHERRVGLIARAIAAKMGWPPEQCDMMEMVGQVHDIGKIVVPAEILVKPTLLSKPERELIQGHAQAGYDILKDVAFDAPVAEIILQHHERLDGSGYPRGLKGDEILPGARILAVADTLESMAAHRPYRPALGINAALAELEHSRGKLFDPAVVDALLQLIHGPGFDPSVWGLAAAV